MLSCELLQMMVASALPGAIRSVAEIAYADIWLRAGCWNQSIPL